MRRVVIANRRSGGLWWRVPTAIAVWLPLAAPVFAALWALNLYAGIARTLPEVPDLDAYAAAAPRSSVILAADGTRLATLPFSRGAEVGHRFWRRADELPQPMIDALLAAEDVRFFSHSGVDVRAVLRAARANYRAGRTVEGASTITQQLARNLLPGEIGFERSVERKLREMLLARRLERRWSKAQILETYANLVFLGAGAYGVEAAARAYFGRPLAELDLAQCALVAGQVQAPSRTDPFVDPAAAKARRDEVLGRMVRAGFVSDEAARAAIAEPLQLTPVADAYGHLAPWLTERARLEVLGAFPDEYAAGGLTIRTTALPLLDAAAQDAVRAGTGAIAARQRSAAPQAAAVGLDVRTGYLEVLVGGLDWQVSRFDRALLACRQPGSTFKPIVYAAAIERDDITLGTPLRDAPVSEYDESRDVHWKPRNVGRAFRGVALAVDALAASLNAPAIDVMDRVGPTAAIALARKLGITTELSPVRPLVLGASCVIPLELVHAFAAFATLGQPPAPIVVTSIRRGDEPLLFQAAPDDPWLAPGDRLDALVARLPAAPPVLDPRSAYLVGYMLHEAARRGTGHDSRALDRPVAGKTGTTNDESDAWFVGFTARLAVAVWVGHDDPAVKLGKKEDGSHAALPIWMDVVRAGEADRPARPVLPPAPAGIDVVAVDRATGRLASGGPALSLPFKTGTAPDEAAEEPGLDGELERETGSF